MAKKPATPSSKKRALDKKDAEEGSAKSQKRALKQERQSQRKHAEIVIDAKQIWNSLRHKSNSPKEVRRLTSDLMSLIRGKATEIALQHDASRVVQAAIQFGNKDERLEVVTELCKEPGNLFELSKNQYAHFVTLKCIKYCHMDEKCVKIIVKSLKGNIAKLATHASGSTVLESLFDKFPSKSLSELRLELYGPHFALFANESSSSSTKLIPFLEAHPEKRPMILSFLKSLIDKGIEKSFFTLTYFQDIFADYISAATPNDIRAMAPSVADHAVHLLSSKAGAKIFAAFASYGTAKDRKRLMKGLKGYARSGLLHRDAYIAVLRLVEVTDDTVSTQKNILNEVLSPPDSGNANKDNDDDEKESPLLEVVMDNKASKLFLMLLADEETFRKKYCDPYERSIMTLNPKITENGEELPTSRKNPATKRKELMQNLQKPLIDVCIQNSREMLCSLPGSVVIREVYEAFHPEPLVKAIVDVCLADISGDASSKDDSKEETPIFEQRVGQIALKNLILCDEGKDMGDDCSFAKEICSKLQNKLLKVAGSNRGAFLVAALCRLESTRPHVVKELSKKVSVLRDHTTSKGPTAGFTALLNEIEGTKGK